MPLLAAFIGTLASGFVAVLSKFFSLDLALKYASYLTWITVLGVFLSTVVVCITGLYNLIFSSVSAAGAFAGRLAMGLGMLIPANAGACLACVSSVWIACQLYKIQKQGIHNFSK